MSEGQRGGSSLLILTLLILGTMSESRGSVDPDPEQVPAGLSRSRPGPVLQHSESIPITGIYSLKDQTGKPCLKVYIGVEYMVLENKKLWYFNLDPATVNASGFCGQQDAVLSLTLPENTAGLQLTFKQDGAVYYAAKLTAHISPLPVCKGCKSKDYRGVVANERLFQVPSGCSFKCNSQSVLVMSSQLTVKLGPVRIQAFNARRLSIECWADIKKRVIPIVVGSAVMTVLLITLMSWLICRDHRGQSGYNAI